MSSRFVGWLSRTLLALCVALAGATADALAGAQPEDLPPIAATADLAVWRTVTLGTRKGVNAYREALETAAVRIGESANEILGRPTFAYARTLRNVELVLVTGRDIGMQRHEPLASVYARARRAGLELCPAEVGPQLRLAYRQQQPGEVLHIAMEPVATWSGSPTILALANFGALLLIGSDGRAEFLVPPEFRFVFARPDRRWSEAHTR